MNLLAQGLGAAKTLLVILDRMQHLTRQQQQLFQQLNQQQQLKQKSGDNIDANQGLTLAVATRRLYLFYLVDSLMQRSIIVRKLHGCVVP